MEVDEKGFWYPDVDTNQCIECKKCIKVCQIFDDGYKNPMNLENIRVYAVKHNDNIVRNQSSSGGMFTALSDYIIENEGIVYGAIYGDDFKVIQRSAINAEQRNAMRGSKYVQSYVGNTFKETEELLKKGKLILYTGTPCQISGLYKYLGKDYDNLITCDLVCHGTPSPQILKNYLHFVQDKEKDKLINVNFRHKKDGWKYSLALDFEKKSYINLLHCDPYGKLFLDNIILRPSCYECKYMNTSRVGDITVGDYWGIERNMPDFYDDKGISLVFINTEKGQALFNDIKKFLILKESKLEECTPYNKFNGPVKSLYSKEFWSDYTKRDDFSYILIKYAINNIISNKSFINMVVYKYVINTCKRDGINSFSILNILSMWKKWCDKTFLDIPIKNDDLNIEYQENRKEVLSYGGFIALDYYANKRYI
jgi:coenzyme F420-reducing hydrogenase beta subunit